MIKPPEIPLAKRMLPIKTGLLQLTKMMLEEIITVKPSTMGSVKQML
jgi:hypothetical protein